MPSNFVKKPEWLRIKMGGSVTYGTTRQVIEGHCLHTICSSGRCPNQGECWSRGTATFMIGGNICTRSCRFCNTLSGRPLTLDANEPQAVAESVRTLKLKHAVITSVDRDDLPDGGAEHWVKTILAIKQLNPGVTCEVLIPDFRGDLCMVEKIISAQPEVISHNMETVRRLTPSVRSVATYDTSLAVLHCIAQSGIPTKTGLMLGLGEREEEIINLMDDVRERGVSILTIGQYLRPSRKNIPVVEYHTPEYFDYLKEIALSKGFTHVESAPLVRSSYHAEQHVIKK
ncbi:lipoyl synthase [Porphyromonas circumdentaria]|uniref:Lipoyl synthase n=1 Tax=Porphyromonas circumdentaria TaxID=29524 RepID=A0A1T4PE23_9PORP|nr:lipoyl synthase [Porphyromonas circumdentaria]MBB6275690.1 lipoic acid synthetase [Porphyromonas circumdentaria]MDO4723027.1 lipoyl synthase [Porphyromonas circumdentaria]SJZ89815.1 lipoic acid synthetase [Porphyromonas circumdentaria]